MTDQPTPARAAATARPNASSARQQPPIEGRRPMAAGHVILVVALALVIGTVLNAPGLYKTARNQRPGWQRTVAVGVMTPVKWTSQTLGLSLPREFLQSATGQTGADKIDTYVPPPSNQIAAGTPTTTMKPVATPYDKVRIWVAGDSLADTPGRVFQRKADTAVTDIPQEVDSRVSTGLARTDVFNWFTHIKQETARLNPDVVILTFGANDDQYLVGGGKSVGPFGSEAWKAEYRRRVGGLMDQIISENRRVVWTGIPVVRDDDRSIRYSVMNAIYKEEAEKRPGQAYFVETWPMFVNSDKVYSDEIVIGGAPVRVRAPDGIHFTRVGGELIADAQMRKLAEFWDLTTGRNATTTAAPTTAPPPTTKPR